MAFKVNGKKRYILGIPTAVFIFIAGYGTLRADVANNKECIKSLQETPVQIAEIRTGLKNIEKRFDRFELKQDRVNDKMYEKLDKIFERVTR